MIQGYTEWDIEVRDLESRPGFDSEKARTHVILKWMGAGDFRPLAAAITEGRDLDDAVLKLLAKLITDGHLILKRTSRNRPPSPVADVKRMIAAATYDMWSKDGTYRSDQAFAEIAKFYGMSEPSVRGAVTQLRKRQRNK
jgi:hypothetical protein